MKVKLYGVNSKSAFFKRKRKVEGRVKGREKRKGKEKGKFEVQLWQERKKWQTPKPGIESGTPANVTDALPLSHRDKRHHQPVCSKFYSFCLHFLHCIHLPLRRKFFSKISNSHSNPCSSIIHIYNRDCIFRRRLTFVAIFAKEPACRCTT